MGAAATLTIVCRARTLLAVFSDKPAIKLVADCKNTVIARRNKFKRRAPRKRANLFNPILSRFDGCCILRAKSRHSTCISGLSLERYCARQMFARYRSAASLSIGTSPSMSSSLSLIDWPEWNDYGSDVLTETCERSVEHARKAAG